MRHRSRGNAWLWAALTVAVVVASAATAAWLRSRTGTRATVATTRYAVVESAAPAKLVVGRDYYLHVKLVELAPAKPDGGAWDRFGGGPPDVTAALHWRGHKIHQNATRGDRLIAVWDLLRADVAQLLTNGGKIDLESALDAPLVNVAAGEAVTLEVWDDDPAGSDLAAKLVLPLEELLVGENQFEPGGATVRVVLQCIDRATDVGDLVALAGKR